MFLLKHVFQTEKCCRFRNILYLYTAFKMIFCFIINTSVRWKKFKPHLHNRILYVLGVLFKISDKPLVHFIWQSPSPPP